MLMDIRCKLNPVCVIIVCRTQFETGSWLTFSETGFSSERNAGAPSGLSLVLAG